jgi:hypothetical protein
VAGVDSPVGEQEPFWCRSKAAAQQRANERDVRREGPSGQAKIIALLNSFQNCLGVFIPLLQTDQSIKIL